ncbi:uncharacterized protein A4U43_C04F11550 [Asparagus officinalis]|uniref:Uncharacterized protein n=1 Tax=Asparagus officinalis TaxID=4686 RepID=A0A5P1F4J7_ASPOF|nr:uncharacterized protein A4U43_C04F11550 [Asparagus officinalis]
MEPDGHQHPATFRLLPSPIPLRHDRRSHGRVSGAQYCGGGDGERLGGGGRCIRWWAVDDAGVCASDLVLAVFSAVFEGRSGGELVAGVYGGGEVGGGARRGYVKATDRVS